MLAKNFQQAGFLSIDKNPNSSRVRGKIKNSTRKRDLMKKKNTLRAAAILAASIMLIPTAATAATTHINGSQSTVGWTVYPTVRSTTFTYVAFTPTDMFRQTAPGSPMLIQLLRLRLHDSAGNVLSTQTQWASGDSGKKTIMSGLATGANFRIGADGYSTTGIDPTWAGWLDY